MFITFRFKDQSKVFTRGNIFITFFGMVDSYDPNNDKIEENEQRMFPFGPQPRYFNHLMAANVNVIFPIYILF